MLAKPRVRSQTLRKPDVVVHTYSPSAGKVEAGGSEV